MAEETKQEVAVAAKEEAVVEKAAAEPKQAAEKEIPAADPVPEPEPEVAEKPVAGEEVVAEAEKEKTDENKIAESGSFKEESNVVADLPNPQQKDLDELKKLVREALDKHEFTAPPPQPAKEEEKKAEPETAAAPAEAESKPEEKKESEESKPQEKKEEAEASTDVPPPAKEEPSKPEAEKPEETKAEEKTTAPPPAAEEKPDDTKVEEKTVISPPVAASSSEAGVVVEKVEQKVEAAGEEDGIKTIVEVTSQPTPPPPAAATEEKPKEETTEAPKTEAPPPIPEEVSIWGIKLLEDERSDTILLKFLRARDFKVKDAFAMLKSVVAWRKQFGVDDLLEDENICEGLDKVVYLHGVDKEGHPVIYNAFGEFQNKELYQNTFADAEKRTKFLKGMIIFLEKTIRSLDFTPDGICTLFQVIDLKNSPGLFFFKKDLRQAINQALQLFQDNYPEFVAKQVYINVPWWYPAYYRMVSAIFTPRTKSKFVFAGPSKSAETLFKYIAPEKVPVQYGGLSRDDSQEFTTDDPATEETIKPSAKHTVEFDAPEKCTLVWEVRVVGWDVIHGAEFVPIAEGGYTVIVQKSRKIGHSDEPIICTSYKIGEAGKVVLTFDNQTSKRKKLVYRSKTKPSD